MAEGDFQVVFRGELTGEVPEDEVKQRLATLFKMPLEKVEGLFSGKPIVVKRNLDEATARKFEGAFQKAGARCELRSAGNAASETAATGSTGAQPEPKSSSGSGDSPSASAAARGRASMAAAGDPNQTLLELDVPSDFAGMELDQSEKPLSDGKRPAEPDIDIGELSVSQNDAENLSESKPVPPADIDTGSLKLEDADD